MTKGQVTFYHLSENYIPPDGKGKVYKDDNIIPLYDIGERRPGFTMVEITGLQTLDGIAQAEVPTDLIVVEVYKHVETKPYKVGG